MPQASFQSSILGDGVLMGAMKKGKKSAGLNLDAVLSGGALKNGKADFSALLLGVQKAKQGDLTSAVLTGAPVEIKGVDIHVGPILESLPPEVAAVLKKLNITALKNVPQQIASLFNKAAAAGENTQAFIDALAKLGANDPIPDNMFQLIDDPKLAALLQGLNTLVQQAHEDSVSIDGDGMITILFEDGMGNKPAATTSLPAGVGTPAIFEAARQEMAYFENNTITIADLDGDAFTNLKKLMFADVAPFLTAPRTVRVSDGTVMKMAQGPGFLTDSTTDAAMMAGIAGLAPSLPPQTLAALHGASSNLGIAAQKDEVLVPAFLNSELLAQAGAQPKATAASNAANVFAALLGVAQQKAGKTDAQGAVVADPSVALDAKGVILPQTVTPQNGGAMNMHAGMHAAVASSAAAARGIEAIATGLDTNLTAESASFEGFENALRVHADQSQTGANTATSLIAAKAAGQPHPSTHLVSIALQRAIAAELPAAPGTERSFSIQLDPGNLGRVKILLEFGENNAIKAKLLAERPETLSLLQKDAGQLEKALVDAGLDANRTDLSFSLAGGDAFSGSLRDEGGQSNHQSKTKKDDGTEFATIETVMPIFVDPTTGLTHVNVVV